MMNEELEWKTRKERVDKKLKALDPSWTIIKHHAGGSFITPANKYVNRCHAEPLSGPGFAGVTNRDAWLVIYNCRRNNNGMEIMGSYRLGKGRQNWQVNSEEKTFSSKFV